MPSEVLLNYLRNGLATTPIVLTRLAAGITPSELDAHPDPERFSLREAMAHVADWDPIWIGRIGRIRTEDNPDLPNCDEGQMAIDRDYAHTDFAAELARFTADRATLVALLNGVGDDEWARKAYREMVGNISLFDLTVLVLAHDAYHIRQFVEYRKID